MDHSAGDATNEVSRQHSFLFQLRRKPLQLSQSGGIVDNCTALLSLRGFVTPH